MNDLRLANQWDKLVESKSKLLHAAETALLLEGNGGAITDACGQQTLGNAKAHRGD
jgi:hypothetical protein